MIERYSKRILAITTQEYVDKLQAYKRMPFEEFKGTIESFVAEQNVPVEFALDVRLKNGYSISQDLLWNTGRDFDKKLQYVIDNLDKRFFEFRIEKDLQKLQENGLEITKEAKGILQRNNFIFEGKSFGLKRNQFSWNGFTVVNAGFTISDEGMREVLSAIQPQISRIQKLGFGQVLYGPLVILNGVLFGQVYKTTDRKYKDVNAAALYNIRKDEIYLNKDSVLQYSQLSTLSHELGHRHYYKVLSPSQRQRWEAHFTNRGVYVTEEDIRELYNLLASFAPKKTDYFMKEFVDWSEFDWGKFLLKLNKNSHLKEVVDFLAQYHHPDLNIKTARRTLVEKTILGKGYVGGIASCALRMMLFSNALKTGVGMEEAVSRTRYYSDPQSNTDTEELESAYRNCYEIVEDVLPKLIRDYAGKQIKISHSTTEYGKSNPSEDYAEAFMSYIMNMEMPEDILNEFIAMNHIRMGSKKKAMDLNMFSRGYCAEFAIALHEKTGYPIVSFDEMIYDDFMDEYYPQSIHYAVKHPSGKYLDVKELRTEAQIRNNLYSIEGVPVDQSKVALREMSEEDVLSETNIEEEALELAREEVLKKKYGILRKLRIV